MPDTALHEHGHGLVSPSIKRSREGMRAVGLSLGILAATALIQAGIYVTTNSVALLADLIHNAGDALTAVPLGAAFLARSFKAERLAGFAVVLAIFVSACFAGIFAVERLINPQPLDHRLALALAGVAGFAGNEIAAHVRLRAGKRLRSAALIADGHHARVDGLVSLAVVGSAVMAAVGLQIADPVIGLGITGVILRITWQSFKTVREERQAR